MEDFRTLTIRELSDRVRVSRYTLQEITRRHYDSQVTVRTLAKAGITAKYHNPWRTHGEG